ncbi:Gfo/Idh/MocA family oxidoreductase [Pseudomonas tumuqii]|uniref:Gfo/Idh/MocA family oxidoreductase n=1 Tax=Pseudomonas tumuqii TaxID=2715755 RepID=UPI0015545A4C|nr:Gfo/Idh/MocA family oxidoreductase [Pseudomonas tumuqii]
MALRLGVIGMSKGNGHPYSWSAIFNGYDKEKMQDCGFPVIPQYLDQQEWPQAKIKDACVTHIWTQDYGLSSHIASAALIENIVQRPEEMIGVVDAVLLARDDAEQHLKFAAPFIEAGIPIYIDKPVALSVAAFEELYRLEKFSGQIFTCSALRYSDELKLTLSDQQDIGELREIHAVTPKSWNKYAVHIIEPVLAMLSSADKIIHLERSAANAQGGALTVLWDSGVVTRFFAVGESAVAPISIRVIGSKGWKDLVFTNSFSAFKAALQDFVDGVRVKSVNSLPEFNRKVVGIIEAGQGGAQ